MALRIDTSLTPAKLVPAIQRLLELSAGKIRSLEKTWRPESGTPVFTAGGRYTSRGWTEWTQGFQYGSAILQFDATGEGEFLALGRRGTVERMATHVSHFGVHDHGFNNVSTYGNLLRLAGEGRFACSAEEREFYRLALKVSGAVQAARWTRLADGTGFIHSFNGPHSLFVDTIRSLRALALGHRLGHVLMAEQDARVSLLRRLIEHGANTARYNVYYGAGRDTYDVWGRTAHEAVFNTVSGVFRCPNSQQGYSAFSTWTRGLAWAMCGFAEELEFFETLDRADLDSTAADLPWATLVPEGVGAGVDGGMAVFGVFVRAAVATADFYLENCCADGVPMWDTGAPGLARMGGYLEKRSDPYNPWEPVDSSAAAIAAQGLLRLGRYFGTGASRPVVGRLGKEAEAARRELAKQSARYRMAGLTIARTLFSEPYLATDPKHQGLILHSIYHRPNGWDAVARGQKIPNGESSMWGDYHARELALMILREARREPYLTFFGGVNSDAKAASFAVAEAS